MQATVTHILPVTHVKRTRLLPASGRVLVRTGQKVSATDVLAEVSYQSPHVLVDIRKGLGLGRQDSLEGVMQHAEGDVLAKGDIIAQQKGLLTRTVRAPIDGRIAAVIGGRVLMEVDTKPYQLLAGIAGVVTELVPDRGAVIEANGGLVQGVWGNGRAAQGVLISLLKNPNEELTSAMLDVSMRGAIVIAGSCSSADTLKIAIELPLRGLILSSMTADLIPVALEANIPIVLIEGFGHLPMNSAAFKLLTTNEKRDVCLNATPWNPYSGDRPEVFIPLPVEAQEPAEIVEYRTGQSVRIHGAPLTSQIGEIIRVRPEGATLPTGLIAPAADVRLGNQEAVLLPLANLDVLE